MPVDGGKAEADKLLHELRTRLTELEAQNAELRTAQQKSEGSRTHYFELYDAAPVGVYINDLEGKFLYGNSKCEEIIGYRREELIGRSFLELNILPEGSLARAAQLLQDNINGKPTGPDEMELISKDRRRVSVEINTSVIQWRGEKVALAFVNDITARNSGEDALRASEERYRTILDQMQDSYYELDLAGNFTFLSESAGHITGYSREEMLGQSYRLTALEDDTASIFAAFNEVYSKGKANRGFPHRLRHKDGSIKFSEVSIDLKRNEAGKITGFKCVSRDITGRRQMEEELRKLASIVRSSGELVNLSSTDGTMTFLNDAGAKMLGIDPQNINQYNIMQVIPGHLKEKARTEVLPALLKGSSWEGELQYLNVQTGHLTDVYAMAFAIKDPASGEPLYFANVSRDITGSKKAGEALHLFKDLVENSTDAIGLSTPTGKHYYQNAAFDRMFGDIGDDPRETVYVDKAFGKKVFQTIMSGGNWQGEVKMYGKDGTVLDIFQRAFAIKDQKGRVIGLSGQHTDITERRRAEEALQESEEKYRSLVENINDVFYMLDSQGIITYISPVVERFTLYKVGDLTGKPFTPLVHPDDLQGLMDSFSRLATGQLEPWEFRVLDKDGRVIFVRSSSRPILKNGRVMGFTALMTDMTERRKVEEAIRESEEKYRIVVENAKESIFIAVDGVIKFANNRIGALSGYTQEELLSRPFSEFIHPDDRQMVAERYVQWLKGEEVPTTDTLRFIFKQGDIKWGELSVVPITWYGKPATLGFLTDVTDRKRLDEERQRVEKLESVGLLAGGIAHDFNNILTSILGNISLASMEAPAGSELQHSLEQAEKASQRARDLTKQLLTFSKGGAPVTRLSSVTELLKDTAGFALRGSNVKCHFSIPDDLWHAEIDAGQVSQVIQNLVINAQQAMPAGGTVDIIAENIALSRAQSLGKGLPLKEWNYVRIAVTDHGIGIDAEYLDKIFDPFFTTKQAGSGLGLATSFSIARNHGGHLSVESEIGSGSTFYLYLPASRETVTEKHDRTQQVKAAGKVRILVMDDEKGVREIAGRMLNHIGYEDIEFATEGAGAIELYKAAMQSGHPFSVVILDLTIAGGMGGKETLRKLLKIDPGVKAIVSSGYVDDSVVSKYREYGFSGMVAKPYTLAELGKALRDVIG